jgi:hypothetical protein
MFSRRIGELVSYWEYLDDEKTLASQYFEEMRNMENGTCVVLAVHMIVLLVSIYLTN